MRIMVFAAVCALVGATPAAAEWQVAASRHFIVYADDKPANVAAYTTKLERFDKALRTLRGTPEDLVSPLARVTVFVVPSISNVQKVFGKGGGDVAGFYIPRASQTVAFVPRSSGDEEFTPLVILLHEYSHHFMFSSYGRAAFPAWLVEGFAEFNSTARFPKAGGITLCAPASFRAFGILDRETMPLAKLLRVSPSELKGDQERSVFYARAWLLTHDMTMDADRRKTLSAYFRAINSGTPAAEAGKLLGDPHKLDLLLNAYVQKSYLQAFFIAETALAIDPVEVHALSPGEAAVMPARIASSRGVDPKTTALGVVALARKLAAPYPADSGAQNELTEAEYDARHYAEAEQAADRALVADPKSIHALIYKGLVREAVAIDAKTTDAATWTAVRGWFVKANRLDPEYAYPLVLYYYTFDAAKQSPTASAQEGLLYAHELAPFDLGLGMGAANVALHRGKAADATAMLKPIAYNPHAGGLAIAAHAVLTAIDIGGAAGGLAMMEKASTGDADKPTAKAQ